MFEGADSEAVVSGLLSGVTQGCGCGTCPECSGGDELARVMGADGGGLTTPPPTPSEPFNFLREGDHFGIDRSHGADGEAAGAYTGEGAGSILPQPSPGYSPPVSPASPAPSSSNSGSGGIDLSRLIGTAVSAGTNLLQNAGIGGGFHPAGPVTPAPYQPVIAAEPNGGFSTMAMAPVRIVGTTMELEPDPSQWFSRHPVATMLAVALALYAIFAVTMSKK